MTHQLEVILVKNISFTHLNKDLFVFLEPLAPIYIRAPDPSIILRSDLHRLRAQLTVRPPGNNLFPTSKKKKLSFFSRSSSSRKYKSISNT